MQYQRDITPALITKTSETSKTSTSQSTPPSSFWLTNDQVLELLDFYSQGIVVMYKAYYDNRQRKYIRMFFDLNDMIKTVSNEVFILLSTKSINISDGIDEINLIKDYIIIPDQLNNTEIKIKLSNSFQTRQLYDQIKIELRKRFIENQKYIRIKP